MKIRVSKKTRTLLIIYLAVLVALYIVVFQMPKMSEKFETTQVLENGTLEVSCEATGYIIKEEAVCTATEPGTINYKWDDGTVVKKGSKIIGIKDPETEKEREKAENAEIDGKYEEYLEALKDYDLLEETKNAPISGVFSLSIDGGEKYFSIDHMDKIKKNEAAEHEKNQLDLKRETTVKGEPVFKISNDDVWYILCWTDKESAEKYEEGEKVRITIGDSSMDAKVYKIKKDKEVEEGDEESYKMIFYLNVYYKDFCSARKVDMTVVQSNTVGLIVDNECIVEKDGQKGVYVKTKDGDTYFKPIKVKITDGKQSVIYESVFVNDKYEQVETVRVYQEVLRQPQQALEEDMADD